MFSNAASFTRSWHEITEEKKKSFCALIWHISHITSYLFFLISESAAREDWELKTLLSGSNLSPMKEGYKPQKNGCLTNGCLGYRASIPAISPMESCVLPVHKTLWKTRWSKTYALGTIIRLHKLFTSAGDQILVCNDGRQQRPLYSKSQPKRELATVTRLQDLLQPFVFLSVSLMGDFHYSIKVGTVCNSGIISPLNCNPMSVKMALNMSQHFIMFLPVFIPHISVKVTVFKSKSASSFLKRC